MLHKDYDRKGSFAKNKYVHSHDFVRLLLVACTILLHNHIYIRLKQKQKKQKLTAGNQPARSHLASGPAQPTPYAVSARTT
jgi:hypothetical protein